MRCAKDWAPKLRPRPSVSSQCLFRLGLPASMEQAANLLGADLGFRSMVRQLVKTAQMRGDAKTVLKSMPLVSAIVAVRRTARQSPA